MANDTVPLVAVGVNVRHWSPAPGLVPSRRMSVCGTPGRSVSYSTVMVLPATTTDPAVGETIWTTGVVEVPKRADRNFTTGWTLVAVESRFRRRPLRFGRWTTCWLWTWLLVLATCDSNG